MPWNRRNDGGSNGVQLVDELGLGLSPCERMRGPIYLEIEGFSLGKDRIDIRIASTEKATAFGSLDPVVTHNPLQQGICIENRRLSGKADPIPVFTFVRC